MADRNAAASMEASGQVWESLWDARLTPVSIHELEIRVREADYHASQHRAEVEALSRRIQSGTQKIAAAIEAGVSKAKVIDAERRLHEMREQRDQMRERYLVPHEVLSVLLTTARALLGRRQGSWLAVSVPGVVRCAVTLEPDDVPF